MVRFLWAFYLLKIVLKGLPQLVRPIKKTYQQCELWKIVWRLLVEIICYLVSLLTALSLFFRCSWSGAIPEIVKLKIVHCCIEHSRKQFHFQPNEIRNFCRKLFVLFGFFVFQYPKRKMACMYRIYRRAKRASVLCYFFVTVKFFHNFMWNVFSAPFRLEASRSYNTIQYINQKERNVQSARSAPRITASGNINWGR